MFNACRIPTRQQQYIPNNNFTCSIVGNKTLRLNNSVNEHYNIDLYSPKGQLLKNIYHHIGIYSYKVGILEKFISLDQTNNEKKNKLEQLRALDNNLKINVALAKSSPIGVDTEEDYLAIKKIMEYKI